MSNLQPNIVILPEDMNAYLAFRKHREKFMVLLNAGVLDLVAGKVEVNVHNGQFQTIHMHQMTYKREGGTIKG